MSEKMQFFLPESMDHIDPHNSPLFLKNQREALALTQQQVANGARIQLRQYQRFEMDESRIENASLRVALPICAVLKIDPFVFIDDARKMNAYVETVNRMEGFLEAFLPKLISYEYGAKQEYTLTPGQKEKINRIARLILEIVRPQI